MCGQLQTCGARSVLDSAPLDSRKETAHAAEGTPKPPKPEILGRGSALSCLRELCSFVSAFSWVKDHAYGDGWVEKNGSRKWMGAQYYDAKWVKKAITRLQLRGNLVRGCPTLGEYSLAPSRGGRFRS